MVVRIKTRLKLRQRRATLCTAVFLAVYNTLARLCYRIVQRQPCRNSPAFILSDPSDREGYRRCLVSCGTRSIGERFLQPGVCRRVTDIFAFQTCLWHASEERALHRQCEGLQQRMGHQPDRCIRRTLFTRAARTLRSTHRVSCRATSASTGTPPGAAHSPSCRSPRPSPRIPSPTGSPTSSPSRAATPPPSSTPTGRPTTTRSSPPAAKTARSSCGR